MAPEVKLIDPEYFAKHGLPWHQHEWLRANAPVLWHDEPNGPGFRAIARNVNLRMSLTRRTPSAPRVSPLSKDQT
jgi:hypothetical protein